MHEPHNEKDQALDLYLLLGQSNMAGRGEVEPEDQEIHTRVFALDHTGAWRPAADPIHFDKPIAGVGPGLTFAKALVEHDPNVRIGLIPCAAGGSPISTWQPGGYWEQTNSHPYDDAIARARLAMRAGTLYGALWHQGESDSNENDAPRYQERLIALINRLRSDLDNPELAFVAGTLGDFTLAKHPEAYTINQTLLALPRFLARTACVSAAELGHKGDGMHFGAAEARELGRRYAAAILHLQGG